MIGTANSISKLTLISQVLAFAFLGSYPNVYLQKRSTWFVIWTVD